MGPMMKEEIIQEPIITLSIFLLSDVLLCETGISHRMSSLFGEVLKNFFELERLLSQLYQSQRHLYCKVYSWIVFLIVLDKVLPSKCLASQDTPTGEHPISRHSKPPSKAVAFSSAVSSGNYHQSSLQKLPFCLIRLLNTDLRWDYMEAPPHSCLSW